MSVLPIVCSHCAKVNGILGDIIVITMRMGRGRVVYYGEVTHMRNIRK